MWILQPLYANTDQFVKYGELRNAYNWSPKQFSMVCFVSANNFYA